MFDRFQKKRAEAVELDLIPVMNLFMVLIPFLLMGASFYHIAVIPTSLPQHSNSETDVPKTPTTVSMNMQIEPDKVSLTASSTSMSEAQLEALAGEWPMTGEPPTAAIQKHLLSIKKQYPESNTVIVLPHEELNYQKLVRILDVTRDYEDGKNATGDPIRKALFPVVVFSRFIPEEPEAAPVEGGEVPVAEGAEG